MHDIDRAMFEVEREHHEFGQHETFGQTSGEAYESEGAFESHESHEAHEMHESHEMHELEAAAELLEAHSEMQLEDFLGDLVRSAASAARGFANSAAGQAVGGILKDAARRVLPQVGRVIGDAVVPGAGGQIGQSAGKWLGSQFELEGLSAEDREFETAQAFVRFATETAKRAAAAPPTTPPAQAAQNAAIAAARQSLPGLVPVLKQLVPAGGASGTGTLARSGRWIRRGNRIVLLGV